MNGFSISRFDSYVYFKLMENGNFLYLLIYVDDMVLISKDMADINQLKQALKSEFEMKNLGAARKILGIDIQRNRNEGKLSLSQSSYIAKVLKEYRMLDAKIISTPIPSHYKLKFAKNRISDSDLQYMKKVPYSNVVGSLIYVMIASRLDIAYGVGLVSRFMSCPSKEHW